MLNFKVDCELLFEAENIKEAKEVLYAIECMLSNYDTDVKLNITDRLFGNGKD